MKIYHPRFLIFIFAACISQFAADIYAPCIPSIASDMRTSINYVQLSMSVYMFGVAISQLFYGPISEGIGRKKPMVAGLLIMAIGSIICIFAPNIEVLIIGRLVQGAGAGACASLWRAVFRDTFSGEDLSKYASYLIIFIMFIVPSAPLLGGYMEEAFGWESTFVFLTVYSLLGLFGLTFTFKETNKHLHISRLNLKYICSQYKFLLMSPLFMGVTSGTFLSYGAFFAWFVAGPVLLIEKIGISPSEFGLFTFFGGGGAFASAGFINGRLVKRLGMVFMLRCGWSIMILSGVSMSVLYYIYGVNLWAIAVPALFSYFGSTFIWPNAVAIAFTPFGNIAGYVASLYGFMQICGGGAVAALIAYLPDNNQLPLATVLIVSPALAWMIYEMTSKSSSYPQ